MITQNEKALNNYMIVSLGLCGTVAGMTQVQGSEELIRRNILPGKN